MRAMLANTRLGVKDFAMKPERAKLFPGFSPAHLQGKVARSNYAVEAFELSTEART